MTRLIGQGTARIDFIMACFAAGRDPTLATSIRRHAMSAPSIETTVNALIACINGDKATTEFMEREIRALAKDAARYRWLRDAKPNQLYMTRNEHACNYWSAAEEIDNTPEHYSGETPEQRQAMKDADTIWTLQIYPHTPVGFNWWHRATLDELIDEAMRLVIDQTRDK